MLPTKRQLTFLRGKHIVAYAAAMTALLFVLKWLELRLTIISHEYELYAVFLALIFTALGIWLALKLAKPPVKTIVIEKTVAAPTTLMPALSKREREVLELLAQGLSNRELAEKLFVSENTIKTHISKLFAKLEVTRRTQAIDKAKKMGILP